MQGSILIAGPHVTPSRIADEVGSVAEKERVVYWTDASKRENLGCGNRCCPSDFHRRLGYRLSWSVRASEKTQILEIYAIAKALELAEERCRTVEAEQRPSSLCEKALDFFLQPWQSLARLREIPDGEELIGPGLLAVEELSSLDVQMELGWVPGHAGKLVNQLADQAANRGSKHCVGRRRAGRLMTLCGKREGNGLHTSRPIPWRLHLHPSTQAPKVPSDFVVEANTSRSSAQGRVWPVSSRGSKADERFRSTMSLERLWYGRGRRGIQSRGNSKKNRGHKGGRQ